MKNKKVQILESDPFQLFILYTVQDRGVHYKIEA
jgi:hypothetical protein